ncbi:cytochrome P450 [Glonium stellatum]|uniref:Cytochrome P450 n=1 Tax=Glonium stellatum TaxID=574774 RepID=A0A8E2F3Y8_9PEZI|nr:cytochrome P450 [Glonium stellatum]
MALLIFPSAAISGLPLPLSALFVLFLFVTVILLATYLYTTLRYRLSLRRYTLGPARPTTASPPPQIPYTIPFIGNAYSLLISPPGVFWKQLFRWHPRATGACTLLLGGRPTHFIYSPHAVQALLKARGPTRDSLNLDVAQKGLGIASRDVQTYYGFGEPADPATGLTPTQQQEKMNHDFLLRGERVNELTAEFTRALAELVAAEPCCDQDVGLCAWLARGMFRASTEAVMGRAILDVVEGLVDDFWEFDRGFMNMLYDLPSWFMPKSYQARAKILDGMEKWHAMLQEKSNDRPDPEGGVGWDPLFGSRANRAKHRYFEARGLSLRARAGLDLGFIFGLSSNAIPATGWMLMHILNPEGDKTLLRRVMEEVETAKREDGTVDIPTLISLPLLQSVFHEVLRLYVDVWVTRELKDDLILPLDDEKKQVFLKKNGIVVAPSSLGHRDEARWLNPPSEAFYAERFLRTHPETGKAVFSLDGTTGKFYPFGGGKSICPGRVFAKQEVLGSVAMMLLAFEFDVVGFVDEQGRSKKHFPTLRNTFSGSGVMPTDGDIRVKMRRRDTKA